MANVREIPAPLEVRLEYVSVLDTNTLRLWVEIEPERYVSLDFPPGSEGSDRILEVLSEVATRELNELARRGVVISDFTSPGEDETSEDEE